MLQPLAITPVRTLRTRWEMAEATLEYQVLTTTFTTSQLAILILNGPSAKYFAERQALVSL